MMALELRTEFKVALTPSRGWRPQRAAATSATKTCAAPTAPRAFISELKGREGRRRREGCHFASWVPRKPVLPVQQQVRVPGASRGPTVPAAGRTELCATTAAAAAFIPRAARAPAPPGETTKRGWDFKALGGAGRGVFVYTEGAFGTLHPAPPLHRRPPGPVHLGGDGTREQGADDYHPGGRRRWGARCPRLAWTLRSGKGDRNACQDGSVMLSAGALSPLP